VIRGVVIHMTGEQPLLADLRAIPTAADAALVCTNLRTTGGMRPSFIDRIESWFLIPLMHVRFVELPPDAIGGEDALPGLPEGAEAEDLELDEDFLRRIREA